MGLVLLLTQDLLATNLGAGVDGGVVVVGTSSSGAAGVGACRLSFSSVLLIIVTVLIIKVKNSFLNRWHKQFLLLLSTIIT